MAFQAAAGTQGSVQVGTANYAFKTWTINMDEKMVDVSNFNTGGYRVYVGSLKGATLDFDGPYDVGPSGSGGNEPLVLGTSYSFTLGVNSTVSLVVSAIVNKITLSQNVEEAAMLKVSATVTGTYTSQIA